MIVMHHDLVLDVVDFPVNN